MNRFTSTDIHQHLWPPELLAALRGRARPPRLRGWTLELPGEPPRAVSELAHDPRARARQARADGLGLALVSLPGALGIELMAPGDGDELLAAYHDGVLALPAPFRAWASASLTGIDVPELARRLDDGCVGLQLPAVALLDEIGYDRARPLLELLEERGAPLLIHPGPAAAPPCGVPAWWPAVVDDVQQMHAAWYAFRVCGRRRHPGLRVCFALLAGLAPLHLERFALRSGERTVLDEQVFLDTSSYGPRAIDAVVRVLGIDVLVHGSDRPHAAPSDAALGIAARIAVREINPLRLLHREGARDVPAIAAGAQS